VNIEAITLILNI